VDGESEQPTEQPTEHVAEQVAEETQDEAVEPDRAERVDQLSAEQLVSYLRQAHFEGTRGRRGYQISEVNAFLERLAEAVQEGESLKHLVRRQRFTQVRLEHGYDMHQVDHFLTAVVDLDPHASGAKPDVRRSPLLTKLFG
jgi:DivIVA domain-containing protein